eukprot:7752904-Pyramimonas_sp.AAC.1
MPMGHIGGERRRHLRLAAGRVGMLLLDAKEKEEEEEEEEGRGGTRRLPNGTNDNWGGKIAPHL